MATEVELKTVRYSLARSSQYTLGLFAIVLSMIGYVFVQAIAIGVIYGLTA